jgi:hypothetical protein
MYTTKYYQHNYSLYYRLHIIDQFTLMNLDISGLESTFLRIYLPETNHFHISYIQTFTILLYSPIPRPFPHLFLLYVLFLRNKYVMYIEYVNFVFLLFFCSNTDNLSFHLHEWCIYREGPEYKTFISEQNLPIY